MAYRRILTVQDISCVGQCSLTVALPILSVCGLETCVLPSAVLSAHTGGFQKGTFRDLTDDMPEICAHWEREQLSFSAIYTGYLGNRRQIAYVKDLFARVAAPDCVKIVDPVMGDHGRLYSGFDRDYADEMKTLCTDADFILPNLTEACLLTDSPYQPSFDRGEIEGLLEKLTAMGCRNIVLTGVSCREDQTGVAVLENGRLSYYSHQRLPRGCHGTGDIFASVFTGALMQGQSAQRAAAIAADFAVACMKETQKLEGHWYGAAFEPVLPRLLEALNRAD